MEDREIINCLTNFMTQKYHNEKGVEQSGSDSTQIHHSVHFSLTVTLAQLQLEQVEALEAVQPKTNYESCCYFFY